MEGVQQRYDAIVKAYLRSAWAIRSGLKPCDEERESRLNHLVTWDSLVSKPFKLHRPIPIDFDEGA